MFGKNDRVKMIVGAVVLAAAAVLITIQLWPRSSSTKVTTTSAAVSGENTKVQPDGATVTRHGGRATIERSSKK